MKNLRKLKAFTIVEMSIVIAVIAILAAVMIPTIGGIIKKAKISADENTAVNLTTELALWEINNGEFSDDRDVLTAIKKIHGDDFRLVPESAKYGYSFLYNWEENKVILEETKKLDDVVFGDDTALISDIIFQLASGDGSNPPVAIKNITTTSRSYKIGSVKYSVLDQGGSKMGEMLYALETLNHPDDYADLVNELEALAASDSSIKLLLDKIKDTALVVKDYIFKYGTGEAKNIAFSPAVEEFNYGAIYEFVDGAADESKTDKIVNGENARIDYPSGSKINSGAITRFHQADVIDNPLRKGTTELHVNATVDELKDIFQAGATDCVIVLPNSNRYVIEGDKIVKLDEGGNNEIVSDGLKTPTIDEIKIQYNDENTTLGADGDYYYSTNNTLYLAYDFRGARLSLGDVSPSMVSWKSDNEALATVNNNGVVELKSLPGTAAEENYEVKITATYKYGSVDNPVSDDITIYVVRDKNVDFTISKTIDDQIVTNVPVYLYNDVVPGSLKISYNGQNQVLDISGITAKGQNKDGYVKTEEGTLKFDYEIEEYEGEYLFTIDTNETTGKQTLTINPDMIGHEDWTTDGISKQDVTISYIGESGTKYLEKTFSIEIEDVSPSNLDTKNISDTVKIGSTYLFRVGNKNKISLGSLFRLVDETVSADIGSVNIYDASNVVDGKHGKINSTDTTKFYGKYAEHATDWTQSTLEFKNTGVAIIEILSTKGKVLARLAVEVVDATNVTAYSELGTSGNFVLLNNITLTSGGQYSLKNGTLYGNGFTFDVSAGGISGKNDDANYLVYLNSANLDNVKVVGKVYTTYGTGSTDNYNRATVIMSGNSGIYNSYVSNSMSAVRVLRGNATIENSTLKGGVFANLELRGGTTTVKDITTINQANANDKADDGSIVVGAGIAVWYENVATSTKLIIEGSLTQWNYISSEQTEYVRGAISKSIVNALLKTEGLYKENGGVKWVNTGILSASTNFTGANIDGIPGGYVKKNAELSGLGSGTAWSDPGLLTETKVNTVPEAYVPNTQMLIKPTFKHNLTLEGGAVNIKLDKNTGVTAPLDISKYEVSKYTGQPVTVNVTCSGGVKNADGTITFSAAGTYTITYTIIDDIFFNADGSSSEQRITETYTVNVVVKNAEHKNVVINTDNVNGTAYYKISGLDDYVAYISFLEGLEITDYDENGNAIPITISPTAVPEGLTYKVTGFKGSALTKTVKRKSDTDRLYLYDGSARNENTYSTITVEYTYTGSNGTTVTAKKIYTGGCNTKLEEDSCVTPDTLVTLADGTQKEIQYVTYEDQLLVWNFYEGKYDVISASYLMNHGYGNYNILHLNFEDGTTVKVIGRHGFFDADNNEFVFITEENVADCVGHNFTKQDGTLVKLDSYSITEEYTESYSLLTYEFFNCYLEGMLSLTPPEIGGNVFMPFELGEDMTYDAVQLQKDIETYGLCTYEEYADVIPEAIFEALNMKYIKITIGKGIITESEVHQLLAMHFNP